MADFAAIWARAKEMTRRSEARPARPTAMKIAVPRPETAGDIHRFVLDEFRAASRRRKTG